MKLKTLIDWFWASFATETLEKPEPEESMETIKEEISAVEAEVKMTMMAKMLYMIDHKENIDSDCFILANMIIKAQEDGQFAEWLNEETNLEIIERWQRALPKLFGRANKYLFTKKEKEDT